jgi:hypothetical protein
MGFADTTMSTTDIGEIRGRTIYRLDSILSYCPKDDILPIRVPIGFQTDLASVPRVPLVFLWWGDRAHRPAVLHDYLYRTDSNPSVDRATADRTFRQAIFYSMIEQAPAGMSPARKWFKAYCIAIPMWLGVVLGGRGSYHKLKVDHQYVEVIDPVQ